MEIVALLIWSGETPRLVHSLRARCLHRFDSPGPRDSTGWILLGEKTIDGKVDSDQFDFSQKQGKVSRLTVVAADDDFEVLEFRIIFVSGKEYDPHIKHYFREGSRTRPIDLPNADILRAVQIKYRNVGHEHARVQVWAR